MFAWRNSSSEVILFFIASAKLEHFVNLHGRLLRGIGEKCSADQWEKALIKVIVLF